MNRVVITGFGIVSPLGNDPEAFFARLVEGGSGIRKLDAPWAGALAVPYAGIVADDIESQFPNLKHERLDRATMFALLAARQATAAAGAGWRGETGEAAGIFWGTGMGGATSLEAAYRELLVEQASRLKPSTIMMAMNHAAAGQIGIEMRIRGPSYTYSSACSSSAVAVGEAFHAIRSGAITSALAGGSEALLTYGVIKAWESVGALATMDPERPETSCRPFASDRSGFLLGEGAAVLVLEEESAARARGATILAEITGYGNTSDASHIAQPDSASQARAMRKALAEARLLPQQISHINAHGTGTKLGDVSETRAIREVFSEHAVRIPITASKAQTGHTMGATGALELISAVLAMRHRVAPPTAHLWSPDPDCDLDYVPLVARPLDAPTAVMSNSFGFGGSNAVLIAALHHD